jgi:hypothetical protein
MKSVTKFLAMAALAVAAFDLQPNTAAPAQPSANPPSQTGFALKRIPSSAVHHQQFGSPRLRLWESTSGNWSGYAVPSEATTVTETFSEVQGTWTVPSVIGGGSATYSATWVGLDGYNDGTVEQTGTEQDWTGQGQQNYAWFEMYPNGSYEIEAPVEVGDTINAKVQYVGETTVVVGRGRSSTTETEFVFQLTISDVTQKWTEVVPTSYTTIPTAARSSAEWVVEAPFSGDILPLADFSADPVSFSACSAISTSGTGFTGTGAISAWASDPMTMIDPEGGEATPSALLDSGTGFTVAWSGPAPTPAPPSHGHGGR